MLLAQWLRHKAWSRSLGELLFVPGQYLLPQWRCLSLEWFMLWITYSCGKSIVPFSLPRTAIRIPPHARLRLIQEKRRTEAHTPSKTGVTQQHVQLSGATTVKILSTTDVNCPCMLAAANFFLLSLVQTNSWSNLWRCAPVNNESVQWWCGNETETTACHAGIDAYFPSYPSGSILGFPPVTPSSSAPMTTFGSTVTTTFSAGPGSNAATVTASSATTVTAASPAEMSTDPSVPVQKQKHSASLPTALGVGIGVPLGIGIIGFLGFLSWREAARRRRSKPRILSQEAVNQTDKSATAAVDGSWTESHELPDAQRPRELGGNSRMELHSI